MWLHHWLLILSKYSISFLFLLRLSGVYFYVVTSLMLILSIQNLLPIPAEVIRGIFLCGYITDAHIINPESSSYSCWGYPGYISMWLHHWCLYYQSRIFFLFLLRLSGVYFYVVTSLMLISSIQNLLPIPAEVIRGIFLCGYITDAHIINPESASYSCSGYQGYISMWLHHWCSYHQSRIFFLFLLRLSGVYFYVVTSLMLISSIQNLLPISAEVIRGIFLCGYITDAYIINPESASYSCWGYQGYISMWLHHWCSYHQSRIFFLFLLSFSKILQIVSFASKEIRQGEILLFQMHYVLAHSSWKSVADFLWAQIFLHIQSLVSGISAHMLHRHSIVLQIGYLWAIF